MFFAKKRRGVAAYLPSPQLRAAEEENIPEPSKELMSCEENTIKVILQVSNRFNSTDPYHIRIILVN